MTKELEEVQEMEEQQEVQAEAASEELAEPVVDEAQLLALANNEGLIDPLMEEAVAAAAEEEQVGEIDLPQAEQDQITAAMETILFMSDRPVSLPKLRSVINPEVKLSIYRVLMAHLREEFAREHRGVEIAEVSLGFQLRTKPHMASVLRKLVKAQPLKLSPATMETLAVVAYKQPVTKDELDQIRGVDSGYVLRNLMEKRLARIVGRSDLPGRPILYGTTHEFLELFSLKDMKSLPPLHEVESMVAASEVGDEQEERQQLDEFGRMVETNTKVLFDDSQIDTELESLREEIANIPTSTPFIDQQKAKDKIAAMLEAGETPTLHLYRMAGIEPPAEMLGPSEELVAQADAAQAERHAEVIAVAIAEAQVEVANMESVNASAAEVSPADLHVTPPAETLAPIEPADVEPVPT